MGSKPHERRDPMPVEGDDYREAKRAAAVEHEDERARSVHLLRRHARQVVAVQARVPHAELVVAGGERGGRLLRGEGAAGAEDEDGGDGQGTGHGR